MPDSKVWYESKTIWINILTMLLGIIGVITGSELIADNPKLVAAFVMAAGIINLALRAITTKPVSTRSVKKT